MRTFVVIPTLMKSPDTLTKLIENLEKDPSVFRIYLFNNTDNDILPIREWGKLRIFFSPNRTIYEMWNDARYYINSTWPDKHKNIAFLNDDIEIIDRTVSRMVEYLRRYDDVAIVYPDHRAGSLIYPVEPEIDYTETTGGAGGMTGYCFMMKSELDIPPIDQNLQLYWGDDDLVKQTLKAGYKIARINGLPVEHGGSVTIRTLGRGEVNAMMEADRAYFNQKYGENRERVIL